MPQPSKNGKAKMNFKNFNDLCTIFSGVCVDIDDTDDHLPTVFDVITFTAGSNKFTTFMAVIFLCFTQLTK